MLRSRPALLTALLILAGAGAARADDPAGKVYDQPGELKIKFQGEGTLKGSIPFGTIAFAPFGGIPDGEFELVMDDGFETLTITGSYSYDGKKVLLFPDSSSIESDLEDLIEEIGEFTPDSVHVSCEVAAKTKIKEKDGIETAKTKAKTKCVATFDEAPGFELKVKLKFKAAGDEIVP